MQTTCSKIIEMSKVTIGSLNCLLHPLMYLLLTAFSHSGRTTRLFGSRVWVWTSQPHSCPAEVPGLRWRDADHVSHLQEISGVFGPRRCLALVSDVPQLLSLAFPLFLPKSWGYNPWKRFSKQANFRVHFYPSRQKSISLFTISSAFPICNFTSLSC